MTWWCSAQGAPWTWSWQPYLGAWLLVALLLGGYLAALRWLAPPDERPLATGRQITSYALGVLIIWVTADWPVGPLGAGYLVSVHTVQYLLFSLVAPPLLVHGTPRWLLRRLIRPSWAKRTARFLSRPLIAFVIFNVVLVATHLPAAVDGLGTSQLGSFAMDMAWLGAGLVFWWQVLAPLPELDPMGYPGRIVFVLLNVFIPTVPAAFLTFADYPIYALYELAPPIGGLSATQDQQLAGLIMKVLGGFTIFGTASVLFFRWYAHEEAGTPPVTAR
jgi:putative membrane protein